MIFSGWLGYHCYRKKDLWKDLSLAGGGFLWLGRCANMTVSPGCKLHCLVLIGGDSGGHKSSLFCREIIFWSQLSLHYRIHFLYWSEVNPDIQTIFCTYYLLLHSKLLHLFFLYFEASLAGLRMTGCCLHFHYYYHYFYYD